MDGGDIFTVHFCSLVLSSPRPLAERIAARDGKQRFIACATRHGIVTATAFKEIIAVFAVNQITPTVASDDVYIIGIFQGCIATCF